MKISIKTSSFATITSDDAINSTLHNNTSLMACSHYRRNFLVMSSWRCEHNWRPDKTVLSCLQLCSHRQLDKTRQFCHISNCVHTANADSSKLGRDSLTLGRGETKLSCLRCEHNWRPDKTVLSRLISGVNKPLLLFTMLNVTIKHSHNTLNDS